MQFLTHFNRDRVFIEIFREQYALNNVAFSKNLSVIQCYSNIDGES